MNLVKRLAFKYSLAVWLKIGGALIVLGAVILWGPTIYANVSTRSVRYDLNKTAINQIPLRRVGIVFGAGIYANGKPTPYLEWRVQTAAKLYKAHRIQRLLLSGDNSREKYDEPAAMRKLALQLGVKASDITLAYAGYSTSESC